MEFPEDLRYTKEHEWVRVEGQEVVFGITDFAQDQLGDIVYVELPEAGAALTQGEPFGSVEAVKAVSDLYSPLSGEVIAANAALGDDPAVVNRAPYGDGWMVRARAQDVAELDGLLSAAEYRKMIAELEGDAQ
jgi:glycine cleavage system H protein